MTAPTPSARPLADLAVDVEARVTTLSALEAPLQRRLADLGFVPGEYVRIVARGALGGEPLAVRVGRSTFALRRHEAACIQVLPQAG
ncbi:MAG: ferrous iron transport protein A [Gammaproteobacteria bacterium]